MKVSIVGAGLGNETLLTIKAIDVINSADIVLTTKRLQSSLNIQNTNVSILTISEIVDFLLNQKGIYKNICVLASGDVGFYSIATTLKNSLPNEIEIEFINGISSFQYLTSKLLIGYEDIKLISLHGRGKSVIPYVCYNKRVFCLTGGEHTVNTIINELLQSGMENVLITVGENLSAKNEKITKGTPAILKDTIFDSLSVMLIENENYVNCYKHIKDDEFIRGKSPMTKECIRTISVEALDIKSSDIVYDIGSGTGSVSVCLARKAFEGTVYAIEKEDYATQLIKQNIEKHGAYNIKIIHSNAPVALNELPTADKVFIGGSTGKLKEILEILLSKNPNATIVVNAVTIETLSNTVECFKSFGLEYEITCLNVSQSEKLGNYNLMKAQNPVYIIKGNSGDSC